jgi:hypothetical protein
MSDWGKGVNNNIGWGQGGTNDIGYGSIYADSNSGSTLLLKDNTAFIIEVKTDNTGTSNDNQFQFTGAVGDYDVVAKQNGVVIETFNDLSDEETITFASSGIYDLEIRPKSTNGFNRIRFNNTGDKDKITDLKQYGTTVWSTFYQSFWNCGNMIHSATDSPNLSICTDFYRMFRQSSANPNMENWDVSGITRMEDMFTFNSAFSTENLTKAYIGWAQLTLQQNVTFGAGNAKYESTAVSSRNTLINTYNWTITDGGQV